MIYSPNRSGTIPWRPAPAKDIAGLIDHLTSATYAAAVGAGQRKPIAAQSLERFSVSGHNAQNTTIRRRCEYS
jgi:hypothetical protein